MKKLVLFVTLIFPLFSFAQFKHEASEEAFSALLKKIKDQVPEKLKGYQSSTLINDIKGASANFTRNSSITVDLDKKLIRIRVVEPPKKEGALKKTGSLTTEVYLENSKVWISQNFDRDPVGNWKLPVNVVGDTLQSTADQFQYDDNSGAAVAKRKGDLTYNLKQRAEDAGFSETPSTQYLFVFGLDSENKGVYMDRVVSGVSTGEKDDAGNDALKNIKVRISLTEKPQLALEE